MCLLGVMDWEGHHPIPPELWLLPDWFPFHPGRLWCHCRMVYLPMCYLYGKRFVYADADTDPTVQSLREELYCQPYDSIDWAATRELVAEIDNYSPVHPLMKAANAFLGVYEHWAGGFKRWVRARGLAFAIEYIGAEDLQTNFIDIGPVNKVLNMLSRYVEAGNTQHTDAFKRHLARVPDYLWVSEDGMKMQGYNGSQGWDTSFALQAFAEGGLCDEFPEMVSNAYAYLERTQILCSPDSRKSPAYAFETCEARKRYYRHVSEGGWPFSSAAHGWPISDCTAEGLKAVLAMRDTKCVRERCGVIGEERLFKAVNVILTLQNVDGGFATYENNRGYRWYEWLNPSEVFGDIMIDYSYVECSMASLSAIYAFHHAYPEHRTREVQEAISAGRRFIKSIQRPDGSWYGSWGCCFTYGTWFGVEGLVLSGEPSHSYSMRRACSFLLSKQNSNGGAAPARRASRPDHGCAPSGLRERLPARHARRERGHSPMPRRCSAPGAPPRPTAARPALPVRPRMRRLGRGLHVLLRQGLRQARHGALG
jgi:squalene/oxidosqualene cyclase-like protein